VHTYANMNDIYVLTLTIPRTNSALD